MKAFHVGLGKRHAAVLSIVALLGAALATGPAKAALADCPEVMPVAEVAKGMMGTGYSVSEGTTPEPFSAEVLGVLENGIGPGRDMIIVNTSSPAIEQAHGIWYGMSGSPVYVGGEFIGALAYGLTYGPSTIAGLTPAEDMLKIADRPTATDEPPAPNKVKLTRAMKARIARAAGTSRAAVGSSMRRLLTPLSVSGVGERVMGEISETIDREKLPMIPYMGSSGSAAPAPSGTPPEAGGNFAAALSYGDVTLAGVGTISYVCEGKVLAFGHPFNNVEGATTAGANHADAITIVGDTTGGSFKLANITGGIGTVDQDRFAGIRAIVGDFPTTIPVTSHIEADGGLSQRDGTTDVVGSDYVPYIAWLHALSNIDFTRDEIDGGSSAATWTITGTSAGGPWELTRTNLFASQYDANYETLIEMETHLYTLLSQQFEDIEFTGVDFSASMDDEVKQYSIKHVGVSTDGVTYKGVRRVRVERGGTVYLRVTLEPFEGGDNQIVNLTFELPKKVRNQASLEISGGGSSSSYYDYYCFIYPEECDGFETEIESLQDLIDEFENAPKNNDLLAKLYGSSGKELSQQLNEFDKVISGNRYIQIRIKGGSGGTIKETGGG